MKKIIYIFILANWMFIPLFGDVAVIVHKSSQMDTIRIEELAEIYLLTLRKWEDGTRIIPYNLKEGKKVKDIFFNYIRQNPVDLKKHWLRIQLTGKGTPPRAIKKEKELLKIVASQPGAIGYISSKLLTDDVKVVATIPEE